MCLNQTGTSLRVGWRGRLDIVPGETCVGVGQAVYTCALEVAGVIPCLTFCVEIPLIPAHLRDWAEREILWFILGLLLVNKEL